MAHSNALVAGEVQCWMPADPQNPVCALESFLLRITNQSWVAAVLDIFFANSRDRDLCSSRDALVQRYGAVLARIICCRLSVLAAAPSLADVPAAPPVNLTPAAEPGCYVVAIGRSHFLLFQPSPASTDEGANPSSISKLLIIGLLPVPTKKA
ncbi:MAG: hypothetical protein E6Q92_00725 [Burkholderiaceae bacterium]|nr:MAG: hypothetical protein E6Q92_00725 [Burkholderiaceae bacterium]